MLGNDHVFLMATSLLLEKNFVCLTDITNAFFKNPYGPPTYGEVDWVEKQNEFIRKQKILTFSNLMPKKEINHDLG